MVYLHILFALFFVICQTNLYLLKNKTNALILEKMEVFLKFIQSLLFVDDRFKYMYTYLFSTILKYVLIDFFLG